MLCHLQHTLLHSNRGHSFQLYIRQTLTSSNELKILQNMFSDHNGINVKSITKISWKSSDTWKFKQHICINNPWSKIKSQEKSENILTE